MTEREHQQALASIAARAAIAAANGLLATAKSWRELYATVAAQAPATIILAPKTESHPE